MASDGVAHLIGFIQCWIPLNIAELPSVRAVDAAAYLGVRDAVRQAAQAVHRALERGLIPAAVTIK